ncbi:hypothetical protein D8780_11155 [Notoacmeibacter ruber]|uniref:Uncharacterized protein n=1 Tax=Notoacmeibacter ruber TaxID=2670375 RepID=A0A3L7JDD2_9HYPH|nr:hypothetical protein D8780_11155 [Notoacmeibacter ruber]
MRESAGFPPGIVTFLYSVLGPIFGVLISFLMAALDQMTSGKGLSFDYLSFDLFYFCFMFGLLPAFLVGLAVDIFRRTILYSFIAAVAGPVILFAIPYAFLLGGYDGGYVLFVIVLPLGLPASILVWSVLYLPVIYRNRSKRSLS